MPPCATAPIAIGAKATRGRKIRFQSNFRTRQTVNSQYGVGDPEWDGTDWRGYDAGTNLKQGGSNGFEALLAGYRSSDGSFDHLSSFDHIWTSSEDSSTFAWRRILRVGYTNVNRNNAYKSYGFSVRCLNDETINQPPEPPSSPNPEDGAENQ